MIAWGVLWLTLQGNSFAEQTVTVRLPQTPYVAPAQGLAPTVEPGSAGNPAAASKPTPAQPASPKPTVQPRPNVLAPTLQSAPALRPSLRPPL